MDRSSEPLRPSYGVYHGIALALCLWLPIAALFVWAISVGAERSVHIVKAKQEAFVSFRTANGGQP